MIPALGSLHTGRLVLTTVDPLQAVAQPTIVGLLTELGLVGPRRDAAASFDAGPALGALVGFTGCAVQFDGAGAPEATHGPWLHVPPATMEPRLRWGRNTRPPRCPTCSAALHAWRAHPPAPEPGADDPRGLCCDADPPLRCDTCGSAQPTHRWRWGRHAGAGRSFVLIEEVFPGEARPLSALLQALEQLGAGTWDYFYVQD